ncbi:helix-turn-helix domain-containing protein [Sulfoacidibacillus thermotolerans]|uniref:helix-turn-helix domain-containing protein n=1 Tax=Sulfoacidibacillus thermotolerans TaxID=1765684 RepID=UPI000D68CB9F|nr:helix-turn-helix domain-containing protein [Sulfoacidibacillus thermotolerans]
MEEPYMTTSELCDWLRITRTTVWKWRKEGMPYHGSGKALRYKRYEVEEWLKKRESENK